MLEEPVDFKEGNKINLITFSSTKYHITELNKITEFMLKKKKQTQWNSIMGRGAGLAY